MSLTLEQRVLVDAALKRYGAALSSDGFITKNGKQLSVKPDVQRGRLRMISGGVPLATYPASRLESGVSDFVEKFWFWKAA